MKDIVILTVTSEHGTRQYHIGRHFFHTLKIVICTLALGGFASTGIIYYLTEMQHRLNNKVVYLSELKQGLESELQSREEEMQSREEEIQSLEEEMHSREKKMQSREAEMRSREEEMQLVSDRLGDLEKLLGVDSSEDVDAFDEATVSRLNVAAIHSTIRMVMLNQIPSGPPVKNAIVSSGYGKRIHPVTGKIKFHRGQDFAVSIGTPVYATADGVVEVTRSGNQGSGNFLRLQHSFGFSSSYSHLQAFAVKSGVFVKKGELIGYSGNTGLSSGPHVHYELRFVGRPLNPRPFVDWGLNNFETIFTQEKSIHWDMLVARVESRVSQQILLSSSRRVANVIADNSSNLQ